jgi:fluoride exporter
MNYFMVFIGGGIGSILRFGISELLKPYSTTFPLATFVANVLSCFLLGIAMGLFSTQSISPQQKLLIVTGICGGFSTFSTFANENILLLQTDNIFFALLNILLSLIICFICVLLGLKITS